MLWERLHTWYLRKFVLTDKVLDEVREGVRAQYVARGVPQTLEECQERFRRNLIGVWQEPSAGSFGPGPVTWWEFYPDGTGQAVTESGSGTYCQQFQWQEDGEFTLRFLDGDTFEDGERLVYDDEDPQAPPSWYTRTYHLEQAGDGPWPTFLLHGIEWSGPLEYRSGIKEATCPVPP